MSRRKLRKAHQYQRDPVARKGYLDDTVECERIITELKKFLQLKPDLETLDQLYDDGSDDASNDMDTDPLYNVLQQICARHHVTAALDNGAVDANRVF